MSKLVLHMQKIKSAAVMNSIGEENDRLSEQEIEKQRRKNSTIDATRTQYNFDALDNIRHDLSMHERVQERIAAGYTSKRKIRKDAVRLVDGVIGSDSALFADMNLQERERFARDCSAFLVSHVGRENIVGCRWHNDENPPHLHFQFVPLQDGKLNVKACGLTMYGLQEWHTKLARHLQECGWEIERGNERQSWQEPVKHEQPNEYKRRHYSDKVPSVKLEKALREIDGRVDISKPLFSNDETAKMSARDYKLVRDIAGHAVALRHEVEELKRQAKDVHMMRKRYSEQMQELDDEIDYMRTQNKELSNQNLQEKARKKAKALDKKAKALDAELQAVKANKQTAETIVNELVDIVSKGGLKADMIYISAAKKGNAAEYNAVVERGRRMVMKDMHRRQKHAVKNERTPQLEHE